jgi:4-aminobutyrate aminotransferase
MGGTYAGNAVSCAAGVACAKVMKEDNILDNVKSRYGCLVKAQHCNPLTLAVFLHRSDQLLVGLKELQQDSATSHLIADVRGLGLMIGVEFNAPKPAFGLKLPKSAATSDNTAASPDSHTPPEKLASRVAGKCIEKGMYILTTSVYETIRFIPPLTITDEEMAKGIKIFQEAVREVAKEG